MIKTYCFNHKVCEQIHRIVFATSLDKETTLDAIKAHCNAANRITIGIVNKHLKKMYKKAAKECNARILAETGIYISKNTLEVVLKANECSKYFNIQNYITDLENMKYIDYEYWLDNRLSEIERDLGY